MVLVLPVRTGGREFRRVVERNNGLLFNTPSRLRLDKAGAVQGIDTVPGDTPAWRQHQSTLRVLF